MKFCRQWLLFSCSSEIDLTEQAYSQLSEKVYNQVHDKLFRSTYSKLISSAQNLIINIISTTNEII